MEPIDKHALEQIYGELTELRNEMLELEQSLLSRAGAIQNAHLRSARNLVHYLALRQHDLRPLQARLALLGLSSLGRAEGHVLSTIVAVQRAVRALLGDGAAPPIAEGIPVEIGEGSCLLEENTDDLLGPPPAGRRVRIMVTMSSDAATDYELVRDLVQNGMDCMRINCAHDSPDTWLAMIRNLEKAREETGRNCRILMDIAGPKLRTGPMEPGPQVIKCRPRRDIYGRVVAPARIWLTPEDHPEPSPTPAPSIPLPAKFIDSLRRGDTISFRDGRRSARTLRVAHVVGGNIWAEAKQTIYFVPGLRLTATGRSGSRKEVRKGQTRIGHLPPLEHTLLLKPGEMLKLHRTSIPGRPAVQSKTGELIAPAEIGISLPQMLDHATPGQPIWFDDGKIGGIFRIVGPDSATVEITQARPEGENLGAEKGINLPETRIDIPALTAEDREALTFVVQHADMIGYSFVRTESDISELLDYVDQLGGQHLGLVLKIETRKAFDNLPNLILAAMRTRSLGIMIARGDLAVECGYQRLAEIQEEILWISEAAHIPVIWATQVLETLAKKGTPSRSEITDAAMGERAECVMLNKGPYALTAVRVLADILTRMQAHQEKKRSMLRQLRVADSVPADA